MIQRLFFSFIIFLLCGCCAHAASYTAQKVLIENAIPGQVYYKQIIMPLNATQQIVTIDGKGISKSWVHILSVDRQEGTAKIATEVIIPQNASKGHNEALLIVTLSTEEQVQYPIDIFIQEKRVVALSIDEFSVYDAEIDSPHDLTLHVTNTGTTRINPQITINVIDAQQMRNHYFFDLGLFKPKESKAYYYTLPKNNKGLYTARAIIAVDGERIVQKEDTFSVQESGTLHPRPLITSVVMPQQSSEHVKVQTEILNAGDVGTPITLYYGIHGASTESHTSEELYVLPGQKINHSFHFTPKNTNTYSITTQAIYGNKATNEVFNVVNVQSSSSLLTVVAYFLMFLTIQIIGYHHIKKKQ